MRAGNRQPPREQARERAHLVAVDRRLRVRADRRRPGRLRVESLRLRADDRLVDPARAADIDRPEAVDEVVVADVVPPVRVAVEAADPEHDPRRLGGAVAVRAHRVVDDRRLHPPVARVRARLAAALRAVRAPVGAADHVRLRRRGVGRRVGDRGDGGEGGVDRGAGAAQQAPRLGLGSIHVHVVEPPVGARTAASDLELVGAAEVDGVAALGLDPVAPQPAVGPGAVFERAHLVLDADEVEARRGVDHTGAVADRAVSLPTAPLCDRARLIRDLAEPRQLLREVVGPGHVRAQRQGRGGHPGRERSRGAQRQQQSQHLLSHRSLEHSRSGRVSAAERPFLATSPSL